MSDTSHDHDSALDRPLSPAMQNTAEHTAFYELPRCLPQTVREFMRYFVAGLLAFGVDFAMLIGLTELTPVGYLVANVAGFCLGLGVSYGLSIGWVFSTRRLQCAVTEFGIFLLVGLLGLLVNELVIWGLADGVGLHYALAKVGATGVVFLLNFALRKIILFR